MDQILQPFSFFAANFLEAGHSFLNNIGWYFHNLILIWN